MQPSDPTKIGVFVQMPERLYAFVKEATKELMSLDEGEYIRSIILEEAMTKEEKQQISRDIFAGLKGL